MRGSGDDERFRVFVARSSGSLTRLAFLLCGDRHLAGDLVQTCLIRLYRSWSRVQDPESADAYARTVLLRCWLNERRRPWRRVELRDGVLPDEPDPRADPAQAVGAGYRTEVLRAALAELPPRQRAAVVLRYWGEYSVAETAALMRCSEGTVKSQTARGLVTLRAAVAGLGAHTSEELMF